MLNQSSIEQLLAWSAEAGLLPRVPAGPDRGKCWALVETPALELLANDRNQDIRFSAQTELAARNGKGAIDENPGDQGVLF